MVKGISKRISKRHSAIWQAYHVEVPEEVAIGNPPIDRGSELGKSTINGGNFQQAMELSTGDESSDLGALSSLTTDWWLNYILKNFMLF